uniref:Uncharacterized protein n=1 Tax=Rhizophora mucronata TaxID=61149 RepID=A0A2P2R0Z3_RHIMU
MKRLHQFTTIFSDLTKIRVLAQRMKIADK